MNDNAYLVKLLEGRKLHIPCDGESIDELLASLPSPTKHILAQYHNLLINDLIEDFSASLQGAKLILHNTAGDKIPVLSSFHYSSGDVSATVDTSALTQT